MVTDQIGGLVNVAVTAGLGFAVIDLVGRQADNVSRSLDGPGRKSKKSRKRKGDDMMDFGDAFDMEFKF